MHVAALSKEDRHVAGLWPALWCPVRDLNPEPADSDCSGVDSCRKLWKPVRHRQIRGFSPLGTCGWLWLIVAKRCGEKCVLWRPNT
jgi:hypothetical protein